MGITQISVQELEQILHRQGYKLVPFVNDQAEDVKMRPTPQEDIIRSYDGAIRGLARLNRLTNPAAAMEMRKINDVAGHVADSPDCVELARLFNHYGSDKASTHDYYLLYAALLERKRYEAFSLLEIGLGTNNIDVLSNMGRFGKPGASLRAFRDWAPRAGVFGADIDERILFEEERIKTFPVDQTRPETLDQLAGRFAPKSFDIIIDDGLHLLEPNINTVLFALPLIKDDGVIVVEDVSGGAFPFWEMAFSMLAPDYAGVFVEAKKSCMAVIRRA
jgi:hypothetical protein